MFFNILNERCRMQGLLRGLSPYGCAGSNPAMPLPIFALSFTKNNGVVDKEYFV